MERTIVVVKTQRTRTKTCVARPLNKLNKDAIASSSNVKRLIVKKFNIKSDIMDDIKYK